jgi:hypothetical protein
VPTSTDQLREAVERTLFIYPEIPELVTDIRIEGVVGRESPVSHPIANLVGCADLDDANAEATIHAVRDRFAAKQKSFGWITSPSSRPRDLPDRLLAAGLVKADELAGMTLTDLALPIRANPEVEVRPASVEEQRQASPMTAKAYGLPLDVARWLDEVVLLGGAATLGDVRGRGIYTSMVARRLADARAAGADSAVIQAVRGTSAPVCAKLGFKEIVPLEFYAWVPPGIEMDLHA